MTHSHANLRHRHSEKARHLLRRGGYKVGGAVKSDEAEDKAMIKKAVHKHEKHDHKGEPLTKLKNGGEAEGEKAHHRPDRKARAAGGSTKGKKKGHAQVNVIVAGGGGQPAPHPMMPPPMAAPGGPPPMPPRPPMPPPGAAGPGAGMPPPGMPPRPMANKGGRIMKDSGGGVYSSKAEALRNMSKSAQTAVGAHAKDVEYTRPSSGAPDSNPDWRKAVEDVSAKKESSPPSDDSAPAGEKNGGRQKKARGGLTSAGPLNYDGAKKQGNSDPSWKKNGGSSNEKEETASGRSLGGRAPAMSHGSGGGLGRLDKAKAYGASHRRG